MYVEFFVVKLISSCQSVATLWLQHLIAITAATQPQQKVRHGACPWFCCHPCKDVQDHRGDQGPHGPHGPPTTARGFPSTRSGASWPMSRRGRMRKTRGVGTPGSLGWSTSSRQYVPGWRRTGAWPSGSWAWSLAPRRGPSMQCSMRIWASPRQWVPRHLTQEAKKRRIAVVTNFKKAIQPYSWGLWDIVVTTTHETWLSFTTAETKEQSKWWVSKGSRLPMKALKMASDKKVMVKPFFDSQGITYSHYIPKGSDHQHLLLHQDPQGDPQEIAGEKTSFVGYRVASDMTQRRSPWGSWPPRMRCWCPIPLLPWPRPSPLPDAPRSQEGACWQLVWHCQDVKEG